MKALKNVRITAFFYFRCFFLKGESEILLCMWNDNATVDALSQAIFFLASAL